MCIQLAGDILKRRKEKEREMCAKYTLTVEDLAVFFNVPPSVIKRDLTPVSERNKEFGIIEITGQEKVNISELRQSRDDVIKERIKSGEQDASVWAEQGLWRAPRDFTRIDAPEDNLIPRLSGSDTERIAEAFVLCKIGFTPENAFKYLGIHEFGDARILEEHFRSQGLKLGHSMLNFDPEVVEFAKKQIDYGKQHHLSIDELIADISNLTGAKRTAIKGNYYGGDSNSKIEQSRAKSRDERDKIHHKRMTIAYDLYNEGYSESDIARMLSLSRATVVDYIQRIRIQLDKKIKADIGEEVGHSRMTVSTYLRNEQSQIYESEPELNNTSKRRKNISQEHLDIIREIVEDLEKDAIPVTLEEVFKLAKKNDQFSKLKTSTYISRLLNAVLSNRDNWS